MRGKIDFFHAAILLEIEQGVTKTPRGKKRAKIQISTRKPCFSTNLTQISTQIHHGPLKLDFKSSFIKKISFFRHFPTFLPTFSATLLSLDQYQRPVSCRAPQNCI
jgi:hypothetical protein